MTVKGIKIGMDDTGGPVDDDPPNPFLRNSYFPLSTLPVSMARLTSGSIGGLELRCYVGVELAWHTLLFGACYRFRPIVLMQKTNWGSNLLERASQKFPSMFGKTKTFFESDWKRTCTEWFVLNKLVGIGLFPAKLALGISIASAIRKRRGEKSPPPVQ